MALITLPPEFHIAHLEWALDRPAQINRSPYSGKRTAVANPWHGLWYFHVELAALTEAQTRALRAFIGLLLGSLNTFLLPVRTDSNTAAATTASAAAQNAIQLTLGSAAGLASGMFATVTLASGNRQLLLLTQAPAGNVITFQPPLREAVGGGATVEIGNPTCQVAMRESRIGGSVDLGPVNNFSFDVEEVF